MADLPSSDLPINDIEVSVDAPITEALLAKMGGAINLLLNRKIRVAPFTTPGVSAWAVPENVTVAWVFGSGGGGGGGGGGGAGLFPPDITAGQGGGGGGGAVPFWLPIEVVPTENLIVTVGSGGTAGAHGVRSVNLGNGVGVGLNGGSGGLSSIARGSTQIAKMPGAPGGKGGKGGVYNTEPAPDISGDVLSSSYSPYYLVSSTGGKGGISGYNYWNVSGLQNQLGGSTSSAFSSSSGGLPGRNWSTTSGLGGGGGAGGCGYGAGGRGGKGSSRSNQANAGPSQYASIVRTGDVTTVLFAGSGVSNYNDRPFNIGDKVEMAGFTPASFNGTWQVLNTGSGFFTISNPGPNESVTVTGSLRQHTPGHDGVMGGGGGGGGGGSGDYAGVVYNGTDGGAGGPGFIYVFYYGDV